MSKFRNVLNNVVVSVADEKDDRYAGPEWELAEVPKKSTPKKS